MDANDAASYVQELAGDNANIIFGAMYDDTYADEASITVIATGLEDTNKEAPKTGGMRRNLVPDYRYPKQESRPAGGFSFQKNNQTSQAASKAPTSTPITRLRTPESKVAEKDIQIPDFLKRN